MSDGERILYCTIGLLYSIFIDFFKMYIVQSVLQYYLTKNCKIRNIVKSYVVFKCKYNILTLRALVFLLYIIYLLAPSAAISVHTCVIAYFTAAWK